MCVDINSTAGCEQSEGSQEGTRRHQEAEGRYRTSRRYPHRGTYAAAAVTFAILALLLLLLPLSPAYSTDQFHLCSSSAGTRLVLRKTHEP